MSGQAANTGAADVVGVWMGASADDTGAADDEDMWVGGIVSPTVTGGMSERGGHGPRAGVATNMGRRIENGIDARPFGDLRKAMSS